MGREEDRIRKILADMAKADDFGHKLKFDPKTKTVRPEFEAPEFNFSTDVNPTDLKIDPDGPINMSPSDANLYTYREYSL